VSRAAEPVTSRVGILRLSPPQLAELARLVAAELAAEGPGMTVKEAREYVGVSDDFWRREVLPEIRVVRRGRRRIIARAELDRWMRDNADRLPAELVEGER
jgi:excisionase family DNA binding protein